MQDDAREDGIRRRAHDVWEEEGRPEGRDREHWARAGREVGGGSNGARDLSFGEVEQPGSGHPAPGSGLEQASE
jgi:hypothetical protein